MAAALAELEHQIVGKVLQVVSGPGGVASFLRRQLLGKGLNGPSLPLMSARATTFLCTCAAWSRCGTRPASTPAAATSPPQAARHTT